MLFRSDFDGRIGAIDLPVMVIAGEHDIATTPERMTLYRDGIPGARMDIVSNAGHMPYVEEADAFNAILNAYSSAVPSLLAAKTEMLAEEPARARRDVMLARGHEAD